MKSVVTIVLMSEASCCCTHMMHFWTIKQVTVLFKSRSTCSVNSAQSPCWRTAGTLQFVQKQSKQPQLIQKTLHATKTHIQKSQCFIQETPHAASQRVHIVFQYTHPQLRAALNHPACITVSVSGSHESAGLSGNAPAPRAGCTWPQIH